MSEWLCILCYSFPPPLLSVLPWAAPYNTVSAPARGFPVQIHQVRPLHFSLSCTLAGTSLIWLRIKRQIHRQSNGYSYKAGSCQAGCLPLSKAAPCTFPDGVGVWRRKAKLAKCSIDKHGLKLLEKPEPKDEAASGQQTEHSLWARSYYGNRKMQ